MKSRIGLALLALVGLTTISSAFAPAPIPKPKVPQIYTAMQGLWEFEQNVDENARRARLRTPLPLRIDGTSWAYIFNNNGVEIENSKYQIVLDPKASPATLDLELDQNVGSGLKKGTVVMKGIVKVEGDTLTFCFVNGQQKDAERPQQFYAGNRVRPNGVQMMTLKRVK